ncbi:MAG: septum formation initiator family protein [Chloroflexi bacterium AL-W]|nr:septum formation initiator family protein [Chloroflexi bacterium AL-N1]NOK66957.1 septum formation initiator family protein [Chloroflexi bacterium AL-N10]NOK74751.1 septum formation initiator family protein [Chloroflexi bacterium AL-N5]NOK81559.1 septum formation initiator family protein [Chloroflexi bacterium AL-W]NOK89029.1 septum formation initiator family protein [Chloroflexi bacterium AL-N15]
MRHRRGQRTKTDSLRFPFGMNWGRSGIHLVILGMFALSVWLLASFVGQILIGAHMDDQVASLRTDVETIEEENQTLMTAVAEAKSSAYVEQVAREQLGYAREGDTILVPILPQTTPEPVNPTSEPLATPVREPNWREWVEAFFPSEE